MDPLSEAIAGFNVGDEQNSIYAPHPRMSALYKNKGDFTDQKERRKKLLREQKDRRYDYLMHVRQLTEDYKQIHPKSTKVNSRKEKYENQLMFSEWMVEVPDDFENDWLMMPCPVGKRTLVVANKGTTLAFSKSGYQVNRFPSHLPGGNRHNCNECTILDCIYTEVDKTFWVQDIMCWKSHPIYDTECEFRFYWMSTKLSEEPKLAYESKINPFKFLPLAYHRCTQSTIQSVISNPLPPPAKLDGILFFHSKAHYIFGSNPLVVWLKAYMLPDFMGIEVPTELMQDMPQDYDGHSKYMASVEKDSYHKKAVKQMGRTARRLQGACDNIDESTMESEVSRTSQGKNRTMSADHAESTMDTNQGSVKRKSKNKKGKKTEIMDFQIDDGNSSSKADLDTVNTLDKTPVFGISTDIEQILPSLNTKYTLKSGQGDDVTGNQGVQFNAVASGATDFGDLSYGSTNDNHSKDTFKFDMQTYR